MKSTLIMPRDEITVDDYTHTRKYAIEREMTFTEREIAAICDHIRRYGFVFMYDLPRMQALVNIIYELSERANAHMLPSRRAHHCVNFEHELLAAIQVYLPNCRFDWTVCGANRSPRRIITITRASPLGHGVPAVI